MTAARKAPWTRERVVQLLEFAQGLHFLRRRTDLQLDKVLSMFEKTVAVPEPLPAPSEWVSVEERLPDRSDDYLVFTGDRLVAYFNAHVRLWYSNGRESRRVTHWRELPHPPGDAR